MSNEIGLQDLIYQVKRELLARNQNWLAGLVTRHIVDRHDARAMMTELAVGLVKRAYRL